MKTIDIQLTDADYDLAVALAAERGTGLEDFLRLVLGEIASGNLPPQARGQPTGQQGPRDPRDT